MDLDIEFERDKYRALFLRNELDKLNKKISGKYINLDNLDNIKVGVYKYEIRLIGSIDVLFNVINSSSIPSILTILRMIIDNYSILYLITSNGNKEEQLLRYYLFLLDGIKTTKKSLENFIEKGDDSSLKENKNEDIIRYQSEFDKLLSILKENKLETIINEKILNDCNWKYKNPNIRKRGNFYNWIELYKLAKFTDNDADMIQRFFSMFVHGLGGSLMYDATTHLKTVKRFATTNLIDVQARLINILKQEFKEETKMLS